MNQYFKDNIKWHYVHNVYSGNFDLIINKNYCILFIPSWIFRDHTLVKRNLITHYSTYIRCKSLCHG